MGNSRLRTFWEVLFGSGGAIAIATLGLTYAHDHSNLTQTRDQLRIAETQLRLQQQEHRDKQFSDAVTALAADSGSRMGGLVELERLALADHKHAAAIVTQIAAGLRRWSHVTPESLSGFGPLPDEVQSGKNVLRVITRRVPGLQPDLTYVDLHGVSWAGVDLSRAYAPGVDLRGANLSGARFTKATLRGGHFDCANLSGAHLDHADLQNASFVGADLSGADLTGARGLSSALGVTAASALPSIEAHKRQQACLQSLVTLARDSADKGRADTHSGSSVTPSWAPSTSQDSAPSSTPSPSPLP